mgnify:CR=1 FL=1
MTAAVPGTLHLLPSSLGHDDPALFPALLLDVVGSVDWMIAENPRTTRRFLRAIGYQGDFDRFRVDVLDKRADDETVLNWAMEIAAGSSAIYVSEAGMPCVADPGGLLVRFCHDMGARVRPIPGPSSIILALAASGLNGQDFRFSGYLPIHAKERRRALRDLERDSASTGAARIFMEAPYRNEAMFEACLESLREDTFLTVAVDLTTPDEFVRTLTVGRWSREGSPRLHKRPALFILQA